VEKAVDNRECRHGYSSAAAKTRKTIMVVRFIRRLARSLSASVAGAYAAITEPKAGFLLKFQLHVHGWPEALALTVPPLPPRLRKRGIALTQLLPRVVPASAV
jgi:hypothetical protein